MDVVDGEEAGAAACHGGGRPASRPGGACMGGPGGAMPGENAGPGGGPPCCCDTCDCSISCWNRVRASASSGWTGPGPGGPGIPGDPPAISCGKPPPPCVAAATANRTASAGGIARSTDPCTARSRPRERASSMSAAQSREPSASAAALPRTTSDPRARVRPTFIRRMSRTNPMLPPPPPRPPLRVVRTQEKTTNSFSRP